MSLSMRALSDESEIRDLLYRYARGVDFRDPELMYGCFADDARIDLLGIAVFEGVQAFRAFRPAPGQVLDLESIDASTHLMGNILVRIDGDDAHAETSAVAYLYGPRAGARVVLVRGLQYSDDLRRTDAGWRISARVQRVHWMFEAPALEPRRG
ncbi:MAG: nuclear transport factor 2 family protein [Gammaproteobacteria bacterium]